MTDEQLKIAADIKSRIDKLENEIGLITGICPAIRSKTDTKHRGILEKIRRKSLVIPKAGYEEEIELSNEDCRALADIRAAERAALRQVLANIS